MHLVCATYLRLHIVPKERGGQRFAVTTVKLFPQHWFVGIV